MYPISTVIDRQLHMQTLSIDELYVVSISYSVFSLCYNNIYILFLLFIRDIVKLTAQFVARNGAHFMDQLMMREQKNEIFDFLRRNHVLFTYFTKLVEQYSKVCQQCINSIVVLITMEQYGKDIVVIQWENAAVVLLVRYCINFSHVTCNHSSLWILVR